MGDAEDAAAGAVDAVVVVAFADIRPVEHIHAAVRCVAQFDAAEPFVRGAHDIRRVFADIAGTLAVQRFVVHAQAVEIERKDSAPVLRRPIVAEINHHAGMGVPAACGIGARGHAGLLEVTPFFFADVEMKMVGGLLDELVKIFVEMIAVHALVTRAGQGVPEMADDGVDEKELAVLVPIVAPRIGGAVADNLKCFSRGMITPNAAAERCALGLGCAGPANLRAGA